MKPLVDKHQRTHNYLRISLTEKCNLRCTYCMPAEGIPLMPAAHLMSADEIFEIASHFVKRGVDKIRLTGGEPTVRKDFNQIIERLSSLPVKLALTTNGLTIHRHIDVLKKANIDVINISIDSLDREKFKKITLRDQYQQLEENMNLLDAQGFRLKLNVVLLKGINDDEIIPFINLSKDRNWQIRFIEFMPFDGNNWDRSKTISLEAILKTAESHYNSTQIERLKDAANDTAKNYKIKGFTGSFAVISTVTNPFCDSCNRLRLTADGKLKNCLFSSGEYDLLSSLRNGESFNRAIDIALRDKFAARAGLDDPNAFNNPDNHKGNRSMISIGG
ncbi:MAG: GTP 3',8-cyclase MoaA [Flavobacteriaceae bacterium]|nr:GTP 3',8-cyclase MoaA [Flavobacteriaceae bacterium]